MTTELGGTPDARGANRAPAGRPLLHEWTPVAKSRARLRRAQTEEPGSMQHFSAALYLSDVITKLHALTVIGLIEAFEQSAPSSLSFELARATSTGAWVGALRDAVQRVNPGMLGNVSADEWIADLKTWLTQKRGRADEERLGDVLRPLADLTERLSQQTGTREIGSRPRTPIDLMQIMVEIRNKTTGHHAYGSEFWSTSVQAIVAGADLLSRDSPLWSGSFVLPLERRGRAMVRLLEGVEPEQSVHVPALANDSGDSPWYMLVKTPVASLGELVWVKVA